MLGGVRKGYGGSRIVMPEYNVKQDIDACRQVFAAPWDITITPLDTCGLVVLKGELYQRVKNCSDPLIQAVIENYRIWLKRGLFRINKAFKSKSSVLFDTVAIYLAISEDWVKIESLPLQVTDAGITKIDPNGKDLSSCH